ncbi:hypothetical protein PSAC2689_10177 [Paraburkholderia sacchari]
MDTDPTFGVFFMAKYDEQFRLRIVQEYLKGSVSTRALAACHGVGRTLIRRWVASYREHGVTGLRRKVVEYDARFRPSVLRLHGDVWLSPTSRYATRSLRRSSKS